MDHSIDKDLAGWWRPEMSHIPQGSALGLELLDVSVSDMDSGIECTLSTFASDTKLCGVVNMLEGRDPSRGTWTGWRAGTM